MRKIEGNQGRFDDKNWVGEDSLSGLGITLKPKDQSVVLLG